MNSKELARIENGEQFASVHRDEEGRPVLTTKIVRGREVVESLYLDDEEVGSFDRFRKAVGRVVAPNPRSENYPNPDELHRIQCESFEDVMIQIAQSDVELYLYIISNEIKNLMLEYAVYHNVEFEKKYTVEQFDFMLTNFFRSQRFTLEKHEPYKRQIAERLILAQDEIYELILKLRKA